MKAYKKKLPRYWLGTRQPTDLGYQQPYGIGNAQYTSVAGDSVLPAARTAESNILPSGIGKATPYMSTISAMYSTPGFYGANATKAGVAAGRAIGAVGAVVGGADIVQQYVNQDSHRTAGQMLDTRSVNTYTTPGGNQYTEYGGLDKSAELKYENANKMSKQINNLVSWTGEGATIGSLFPGWGTLIGAGVGALIGGVTNLAGFGDNTKEVKEQMRNVADFTAMQNRQNRSVAESQDVRDAFYARAADGLAPSFGYKDSELAGRKMSTVTNHGVDTRKVNALVSNGETIVPKEVAERGRALPGFNNGYTIPGTPNTDDKIPAHIKASDTILSGHGASQYYQATGDYYGALAMDEAHRDKISKDSMYSKMYRAKNGKLPRFAEGSPWWSSIASAGPGILQSMYAIQNYKNDDYSDTSRIQQKIADTAAPAINRTYSNKLNIDDYIRPINNMFAQQAYNIRRSPIYGPGGRLVAISNMNIARMKAIDEARRAVDKDNITLDNIANQERIKNNQFLTNLRNDSFWRSIADYNAKVGRRFTNMRTDIKNGLEGFESAARNALQQNQFDRSYDLQKELIGIYRQKATKEQEDWLNSLKDRNNKPNQYIPQNNLHFYQIPDMSLRLTSPYSVEPNQNYSLTPPSYYNPYARGYQRYIPQSGLTLNRWY